MTQDIAGRPADATTEPVPTSADNTGQPRTSTDGIRDLADAVIRLGDLALAFGRIDRTAVYHPDGGPRESDTDHTVMLGWVACALAAGFFPGLLDVGLVAQYALIHDAPEVYAGDTPTLRISEEGRREKAARETAAVHRIREEFGGSLGWFPATIASYEEQTLPEARFVRGVDKILPKIVHLLDGCKGLHEHGMSPAELAAVFERQAADMQTYVGEFAALMALRAELVDRTKHLHQATFPGDSWEPLDREAARSSVVTGGPGHG